MTSRIPPSWPGHTKHRSDLGQPRIRFNWGYHDARADAARDRVRETVDVLGGPATVGRDQGYYFSGYRAGLDAHARQEPAGSSDPAWRRYVDGLTEAERYALVSCTWEHLVGGWAHLFEEVRVPSAAEYVDLLKRAIVTVWGGEVEP